MSEANPAPVFSEAWQRLQKHCEAPRDCPAVVLTQVSTAPGMDFVEEKSGIKATPPPVYAVQALRRILLFGDRVRAM